MNSKIKLTSTEPFIDLKINKINKRNEIIYNQSFRQREKYIFFQRAFDFIYNNKIKGDYFEFGVHKARTFRFALRESIIKNIFMDFYAFDSFKGLPDYGTNKLENPFYLPGGLNTSKKYFLNLCKKFSTKRKINIIEGYYENTLDKNLIKKFKSKKIKCSMINIDCDLEKSVKSCLEFSLKFISNGTILYIDDYYNSYKGDPGKGLNKLIKTMLKKYKVKYEKWHIVGSFGQSFILYK